MERGFFYRSNHFVNYYIRTIVFIWDSVLSSSCAKNRFVQKRNSRLVIHTPRRESVFMINSITEAVGVVYCGQCGKWCFSAKRRGFGCGATRGKTCWVFPPYPHAPYSPHDSHCVHNRRPQIVDNMIVSVERVAAVLKRCFVSPCAF